MVLSPEVGLSRPLLVAVSPDVLGLEYVAVLVDNEPGFVGCSRRPNDFGLPGLRIGDAVVHDVELDERAAEAYAAGEAVPDLVSHSNVGGDLLSIDHRQ